MSQLGSMLKWEFTLEYRYKLIHLAILSVVLYFVSLKAIPEMDVAEFHTVFLFFDPVLIGIMFVGAMVLFEKTENTLQALTITPMQTHNYFLSKILSLTTLSIIAGLLFMLLSYGIDFNWFYFLCGIILSSVFLILFGFLLVSRCNSINEYLLMMMFFFLFLFLPPLFDMFQLYQNPIFYLWPSQASFILFGGVFEEVALVDALYAIGYLLFWIGLCFFLSKRAYYTHIVLGGK